MLIMLLSIIFFLKIQQELASWGLQFSPNIVNCKARIMKPYEILQGGANYTPQEGDWGRNIQRKFVHLMTM